VVSAPPQVANIGDSGLLGAMATAFAPPTALPLHPHWSRPVGRPPSTQRVGRLPARRMAPVCPQPSGLLHLFLGLDTPPPPATSLASPSPARRRRGRRAAPDAVPPTPSPGARAADPPPPARRRRTSPPAAIRPSSPALLRGGGRPPSPVVPTPAAGASLADDAPPEAAPVLPCGAMLSAPPCATGPCPYLRYRCPRGHIITAARASPAAVVCPACTFEGVCGAPHRPKHSISSLQALAASRGGFLLSSAYVNARTPVVWACGAGHAWPATVDNVRRGSWCPTCARAASRAAGLEGARAAAAARGGACLSTAYVNNKAPLKWRCAAGHEWSAPANNVCRGEGGGRPPSWCPTCARGGGEGVASVLKRRGRLAEVA